ncbi:MULTISPECIES: hypothetical protein [unclassified Bradyrhizobium]|uniref:hypothetical protein n=1 Tax=Bradyrhizobium TaxID=374 RepID=UPI0028E3774D|nr:MULTISPECIES: hypothetical protein [unclassified Bradyrhizobium]
MLLGDLIHDLSDDAKSSAVLQGCGDLTLLVRISSVADRLGEDVGEYASAAVRRFANLAENEDWLGLMSAIDRAADPAIVCLTSMIKWSLQRDEIELS